MNDPTGPPRRPPATGIAVALLLLSLGLPSRAQAQDAGVSGFGDTVGMEALLSLAAPGELAVVCDHASRGVHSVGKLAGSRTEKLERVAGVFDYAIQWVKPNIAVLHKRFLDEAERPQFVLGEMTAMADNVLAAMGPLSGGEAEAQDALRALADSLTPRQVAVLQGGGRLTMADLGAAQRDAVVRAVAAAATERTVRAWKDYRDRLDRVDKSVLIANGLAQDPAIPARTLHGWLVLPGPGNADWRADLGEWAERDLLPDEPPAPASALIAPNPVARATSPPPTADLAKTRVVILPDGYGRVSTWLTRLNAETGNVLRLTASSEIRDHVVHAAVQGMRAGTVMDALAAVGDWRWEKTDTGSHLLRPTRAEERPTRKDADPLADFLPRDLRVYLRMMGPNGEPLSVSSRAVRERARAGYRGALAALRRYCSLRVGAGGSRPWTAWEPDPWEDELGVLTFDLLMGGGPGTDPASRVPDREAIGRALVTLSGSDLVVVLPAAGEGMAEVKTSL
jgi:hypothetical protein